MEKKILYLLQCMSSIPKHYDWLKERCKIVLSYKYETTETDIYFPCSTWTSGRNKLFEEAMKHQIYDYYVFLDDDLDISYTTINNFELQLNNLPLDYPIITPNTWNYNKRISGYKIDYNRKGLHNDMFKIQTVDWFDGAFNAFHKDTIQQLLPYIDAYDSKSWYYSQLLLILKSNFFFKNKLIQLNSIYLNNLNHSQYPKNMNDVETIVKDYINKNGFEKLSMSNAIEIDEKIIEIKKPTRINGYEKIINIVYQCLQNYSYINFIDVGSANGMILLHMKNAGFNINNVNSVAIDPLLDIVYNRYNTNLKNYKHFFNNAISLYEKSDVDFYVQMEKACSSLNEINSEYITHDNNQEDQFYLPENRIHVIKTEKIIKVNINKLSSIIKKIKIENDIIHFLKIDAQGQDLNVIKSCEEFTKNIMFIMIETTQPSITNGTLYKNSSTFKEDHEYLVSKNFELVCLETLLYSDADALYYNKDLINLKIL